MNGRKRQNPGISRAHGRAVSACGSIGLPSAARRTRGPAFTLIELVVAMGVMVIMLAMAGTIFKVTTDSTGQAASLMDVAKRARMLEQTLRDDLTNIPVDSSVLVLQPQPVNAFWTDQDKEANPTVPNPTDPFKLLMDGATSAPYFHPPDPERETVDGHMVMPRADVLMLFTGRPATSFVCNGVTADFQQVVYGHAEIGELEVKSNPDGAWVGDQPDDFGTDGKLPTVGTIHRTPAQNWHLARRRILVPGVTKSALPTDCSLPGFDPDAGLTADEVEMIWDGTRDVVATTAEPPPDEEFYYAEDVAKLTRPTYPPATPNPPLEWYRRSRMDPNPPPSIADERLGHFFVPRCASFRVEWAMDVDTWLREQGYTANSFRLPGHANFGLVWFDPVRRNPMDLKKLDPFGELKVMADRYESAGIPQIPDALRTGLLTELLQRFPSAGNTNPPPQGSAQHPVWYPNDPYWPAALRITVDLYDPAGNLTRPTRYVMVIPMRN